MAETIEIIRYDGYGTGVSTTQDIHDGSLCRVVNFTGRGIPKPVYQMSKSSGSTGSKIQGMNFEPREITLDLLVEGDSPSNFVTKRNTLYQTFVPFTEHMVIVPTVTPTNDPRMTLKVTLENSDVRYIDVVLNNVLDFPMQQTDSWGESSGIYRVSLIAPYPFWYGDEILTSYEDEDISNYIKVINISVADYTWFSYPRFWITGAVTTPTISIGVNGENNTIQLETIGTTIEIVVDTRPHKKAVYDGSTGVVDWSYLRSGVSTANDFANIFIPPKWLNAGNVSQVTISGTGQDANTKARVGWTPYYIGI